MAWIYLSVAIVLEVLGTSCMKLSFGLTRLWPTLGMFFFYSLSFTGLSLALKVLDVSVAYAIWAGVGIVLITMIDLYVFKANLSLAKLFAILLILVGAVMLKLLN